MIEWNDDHALRPVLRYLGRAELEREPYVRGGPETPVAPVLRTERFRFSHPPEAK